MTILTANLKHLYQRRGVWLWYLIILFLIPMIYSFFLARDGRYLGYLLISYFSGLIVASIQKEILSKPFSFCLPGHSGIPRRLFLWVGVAVNTLLGFVFMFCPGLEFPSVFLVVLAGGIVGMAIYFFTVGITFSDSHNNKIGWVLMPIAFAVIFLKWDLIIQEMIVTLPSIVISSGLLFCWLAWRWLGRESLSRKYCGKMMISIFDGWNKEKMSKYQLARLAEKDKKKPSSMRISSGVEGLFVSRISRAESGSLQQYIWGALYKSFGVMVSQRGRDWMGFLIFLPVLCFLCYMPGGGKNIIFILPGMMVLQMSLWVHSSLSVSGGRRQRFWSALTLAVTTGILITVAVVFLAMGTHLLERIMPQLTIREHEFTFNALNIYLSLVPFFMIPVTFTIGLICHKKPMLKLIFVVVLFQILFAMSIIGELTIMNWRVQISFMHIIIMLLCSWTVFVAVLRYISMRCCLVSQSR